MKITSEQYEEFMHYQRMFQLNSQRIRELCATERSDIEYGFELGQIVKHLDDCHMRMMELMSEIDHNNRTPLTGGRK
jgi:hypothetical protein